MKNLKLDHELLSLSDFVKTIGITTFCLIVGIVFDIISEISDENIIIVFILGVLITSSQTKSKIYGGIASIISVLAYNFLFVEPRFTFDANGIEYPFTFIIMLCASLFTSTLTSKTKKQTEIAARNAYHLKLLLDINSKLQKSESLDDISKESRHQLYKFLNKTITLYTVKEELILNGYAYIDNQELIVPANEINTKELHFLKWCIKNKENVGKGSNNSPNISSAYIPLIVQDQVLAIVAIDYDKNEEINYHERSLLLAMLNQISSSIERFHLNEAQKRAELQVESERFRANLLRSISHDLRTPLTGISGSASSILTNDFSKETEVKLIQDIYEDSIWLIHLVENLLFVSRLENDAIKLKKEPQLVEDLINEAIRHINPNGKKDKIQIHSKEDYLMVYVDGQLIIQVLINLIDNSIKYSDEGASIDITAYSKQNEVIFEVKDNGKGISAQNKEFIFDIFFTADGNKGDSRKGLGLGLALCKSIVEAHNGKIFVSDNNPQGTIIQFTLPLVEVEHNEKFYTNS